MAREKRCGQIGAVRTKRSLQTAFRLPAETGLILPQLLTEPERRLCGLFVNAAQHGQHAVPQTVSRVIIAEIGAVRDVILPVFAQERLDLAPLCEQERPDDRAAYRRNAGNTLRAAAAHQMEQHGLQIVVRGVRGRDLIPLRRLLKQAVALAPCGLLDRLSLREGGNVAAPDVQRHAALSAQRTAERLIPVGLRAAQAVVQMKRAHLVPEFLQYEQERHRVRAARQGDEHALPRPQHGKAANRVGRRPKKPVIPHGCGPGWRRSCTDRPTGARRFPSRRVGFSR